MFKYIADTYNSTPRTGIDDIINFLAHQNCSFVGDILIDTMLARRRIITEHCFKDERSKKLNGSFQTSAALSDMKPLIC